MKIIKRKHKTNILQSLAASDLAFLLIIYFLTTAAFNIDFFLVSELPQRDTFRIIPEEEYIYFEMDHSGELFFEGENIDLLDAQIAILNKLELYLDPALVLSINEEAPWQNIVSFIELALNLQINTFSFGLNEYEN